MDNPVFYIVTNKAESIEVDSFDCGYNLDWVITRAKSRAELQHEPQIIYKLVPVMEVSLEVTTKILTKHLSQP